MEVLNRMDKFSPDDITKEIGLLDIYKASRSKLPKNKINNFSTLAIFTMLIVYAFTSTETSISLLEKTRKWSELGFNFSAGILGFLIAGFTIFASVNDKSLFITMAKTKHEKSGLSYLKYNFFTLMYVFIVYLGFAILCLLIQLLGQTSGFISIIVELIAGKDNFLETKRFLAGISIIVVGTWFFYSLMLLQSFIFNVYHMVMTAIRWEIEKDNQE
ncbi:hypothetical protein IQ225_18380 [Synechocystis salina LEGE 06155]|uniref:hypothetical protein n=1 Tax=Synechocystis sp. LEGE 06083 TaxID=915336 RepID=UPI0018816490|nr:hypothetical protein [Synechocystis sp. LEGE 06083]MBE9176793.1 hypothetical protein [Synechocystis salina LEGE 06155]MBE9195492.1 hypothetical protein [Synechocystis sp. LEGE 06083]